MDAGERVVFHTILGFGLGTITTLIFALQADTVDYGGWKAVCRSARCLMAVSQVRRIAPLAGRISRQ